MALVLVLVLVCCPPVWAGPTESLQEFFAAINKLLADPEIEDRPLERVARIHPIVADMSDVAGAAPKDAYIFARVGVRGPIALVPAAPFEIASVDEGIPPADLARRSGPREAGATVARAPARAAAPRVGSPAATVSYWVQLAAFSTLEPATRLAAQFSGVVVPSTSGRLFLVRVGPFVERAQASVKLHELQAVGNRPFIAEARD